MQYKRFGQTDLSVSEIGLGCQSLGGGLYHRDDQESIRTVRAAVDAGINFFDVSDHHSLGATEKLLGRAFKGLRDRVLITTKAGYTYAPLTRFALHLRGVLRPVSRLLKPMKRSLHTARLAQGRYKFTGEYLTDAVERSLRRLQTDYLDLFQLYKPPPDLLEQGEFYATLDKMKEQGKIRHYGVACLTAGDAMIALRHDGNASVQVAINMLEYEGVKAMVDLARENNVAVIARHPRAIGLLSNDHSDLMGDSSAYEQQYEARAEMAHKLRFLICENRTLSQAAIRFVMDMQGVTVTLPRAVNRIELKDNLGSLRSPRLSQEELAQIRAIVAGRADYRPARITPIPKS